MDFVPYLLLALIILGFLAVMVRFYRIKKRGGKILEDSCHLSGKAMIKLYRLQKEREAKEAARKAQQ